ncbi:hypothetical protein [Caldivirga sp.]|uniref:hypothetical protein n=1 Tax=Caldivirga sp. TaxID=2080243 RepID=UPI0025C137FF|nr:hypothetical protein [Caldivirga sp.]
MTKAAEILEGLGFKKVNGYWYTPNISSGQYQTAGWVAPVNFAYSSAWNDIPGTWGYYGPMAHAHQLMCLLRTPHSTQWSYLMQP